MILGIDFSIKSTAATLKTAEKYYFYSFARKGIIKEDVANLLQTLDVNLHQTDEYPQPHKKSTIAEKERASLLDAKLLIPTIVNCFRGVDIHRFGIEGFSFASTGNRLAQISGYQWVLRWEIIHDGLTPDLFYVYSPMTIKATAGKGNYKKEQMIDAFINSDDPLLQENLFWKELKNNPASFQTKKGAWVKPIDDIVDSYWILRTVEGQK